MCCFRVLCELGTERETIHCTKVRLCGKHLYDDDGEILFLWIPPSPPFVSTMCGTGAGVVDMREQEGIRTSNMYLLCVICTLCGVLPVDDICLHGKVLMDTFDSSLMYGYSLHLMRSASLNCRLLTRGSSHFLFFK